MNEIQSEPHGRTGKKSLLADIIEKLPPGERNDFIDALDDKSIPATAIARVMHRRGFKLTKDVIARYRRGELMTDLRGVVDEVR